MIQTPPRYAVRFLRWFCREDCVEEIEGDLTELFEKRLEIAPQKARLAFTWSVIKYFRPEFIRSFKGIQNYKPTMFYHNLLIAYRSFLRYKSSFFINLVGLSTGLACTLLIYLWVADEWQMDNFHENGSRIYQVLTTHPSGEGIDTWWEAPIPLTPALREEMPEVEMASSSSGVESVYTITVGENHFPTSGQLADNNYFRIFSYNILQGDKNKVLADKSSIVISESLARKLFKTTDNCLGKSLELQFFNYKIPFAVSGVFKDVPASSSEKFDFVASYEVFKEIIGQYANWGNHHAKTYLLLKEGTDLAAFKLKILDFLKTKDKNTNVTLLLQSYPEKYLHSQYTNGVQTGGRIEYVKLFSTVALFILLIACINFMNLSTARASRRIKEVGIKKSIGARRTTLVIQHLGESMVMSGVSVLIALLLVWIVLPAFNTIAGKQLALVFGSNFLLVTAAITFVTGILAGSYPALYLSGFNAAVVLKGKLNSRFGELWLRKGLVVFQFALSIILIVSVIVVYRQIELVQNTNIGYDRKNVIYFNSEGKINDHRQVFLTEMGKIPGVTIASSMWGSIVDDTGVTQGSFEWEGKDPNGIYAFSHLGVDYGLLELLGITMKEGRTFSRAFAADSNKIILNEAAIAAMGLKNPIGKTFGLWGQNYEIIGVARNFNFRSLHETVKPFFFRLMPADTRTILVRMDPKQEKEAMEKIAKFYKDFNPGYPFNYQFLDDKYQAQYSAEQRVSMLSRYFAVFAILISCLGLFGLAAFTAERRLKEISIRKILGSSEFGIAYLLSRDFARSVIISILIALPISYFITDRWLSSFALRIDLEWWYFIGAGLAALVIALMTVGIQTIKASLANPAQSLKEE